MRKKDNVLRNIREDSDLTIRKLGELSGVTYATISLVENYKVEPDYRTLVKLAAVLKQPVSALLPIYDYFTERDTEKAS